MTGCRGMWWLLAAAVLAGPAARAQTPPAAEFHWQQPEHLRGYVPRGFQSDGTPPAVGKGRQPRLKAEVKTPPVGVAPTTKVEVRPVVHVSPIQRMIDLTLPRMPHGYLDPTHPAGPAEPGSAAPRPYGPRSSGFVVTVLRR